MARIPVSLFTVDHHLKKRAAAGIVVGAAALVLLGAAVERERIRQRRDLEEHAQLVADSMEAAVEFVLPERRQAVEKALASRFNRRKRLVGVAVYDARGASKAASESVPAEPEPAAVAACLRSSAPASAYETRGHKALYVRAVPFARGEQGAGVLAVFFDTSYIEARVDAVWRSNIKRWVIQGVLFLAAMLAMKGIFG